MNSKNHIAIATITKAHGVKGLVKIKAFTEIPENINSYGKISNANHSREFNIKIHSSHGDMLIASIEGITTKTEADKLANTKLYINREVLPDTKEEEYYIEDLIGMDVIDSNDKIIGKILHTHNFGSGDIIEVQFDKTKNSEMFFFSKENFPEIDLNNNKVKLAL